MNQFIYSYLSKHYSQDPMAIDRLFVSAFVQINLLKIPQNSFISSYIINSEGEIKSLESFVEILLEAHNSFSIENLVELYEFVISPADKIVNGAVYTPKPIREFIVNQSINNFVGNLENIKIADISCGCGGFLLTAAMKIHDSTNLSYTEIFRNNIFGLDIQSYSITRTKILLSLLSLSEENSIEDECFNLFVGDALVLNFYEEIEGFAGFDIIVGNPPYVCSRHLSVETKQLLSKWRVCKSGHPDLYIPFFQIGIEYLAPNGILGYITMNSFFKSLNGRELRRYFQELSLSFKIIDFGSEQIFKSKNTYTCICQIKNEESDHISFCRISSDSLSSNISNIYSTVCYSELDYFKGWNLQDNSIIAKIEATGTPLGELYKTRHGIATLKNDIYIFKPSYEDDIYYYLVNQGGEYPIEKSICRDIVNSNKINRDILLVGIQEKVIFPYSNSEHPKPITEDEFMKLYPMAYSYLKGQKHILDQRDKGNGKYEKWYCFGRTQSLEKMKHKLFFPKISDKSPVCIVNSDETVLFYNGQAIIGRTMEELSIIKKIIESRLFWYYIKTTSKPYSSGYYSLNGNYIKNFGVYNFSDTDREFILNATEKDDLNSFIEKKYGIDLSGI